MSEHAPNGADHGKQPATSGSSQQGFRQQAAMTVEPPRQEDLQKSYATVVDSNASPKGWYGSMSTFSLSSPSLALYPTARSSRHRH